MKCFPIIPIWLMLIICLFLIFLVIKDWQKNIYKILIIICLFLINLRIMLPTDQAKIMANNLDVLFVIDNTISMNAEDYNGTNTRLSAIKNDTKYIVDNLTGARFALITFDNKARIVSPYSNDPNIILEAVDILKPIRTLYAKGSSLNTPKDEMIKELESSLKKENRISILFFISDGEITAEKASLESYQDLKKYVKNGAVLGYGTAKGGYMREYDDYGKNASYIIDYTQGSAKAVSKIDENNLKQIAKDLNIDYIHMDKQNNITKKVKEIAKMPKQDLKNTDKSSYKDTYFYLVIPLLALIFIEIRRWNV